MSLAPRRVSPDQDRGPGVSLTASGRRAPRIRGWHKLAFLFPALGLFFFLGPPRTSALSAASSLPPKWRVPLPHRMSQFLPPASPSLLLPLQGRLGSPNCSPSCCRLARVYSTLEIGGWELLGPALEERPVPGTLGALKNPKLGRFPRSLTISPPKNLAKRRGPRCRILPPPSRTPCPSAASGPAGRRRRATRPSRSGPDPRGANILPRLSFQRSVWNAGNTQHDGCANSRPPPPQILSPAPICFWSCAFFR